MAGVDLIIRQMMRYSFKDIAQGTADKTVGFILSEVDVSQYGEGTIEVLVKQANIPTGATIQIVVIPFARIASDPDAFYGSPVATVTLDDQGVYSTSPLLMAPFAANFGSMVEVGILAT